MRRRELLAAALGAAGCGRKAEQGAERVVTVAMTEHLSVSSMHLADELGYLRMAGLKMQAVTLMPQQTVPLLAGGKLDVMLGGAPPPMQNAMARGMKIRVVAGREYMSPACGEGFTLYANRKAFGGGPVEARRLKGKRFSVRLRGITEWVLDEFLKAHGMGPEDVERVDLPLKESLAALAAGKVDGMFDVELSRSPLAMSPEIVKVWRLAEILPFHQYSFVIFGESMLQEKSEVGSRFLAAYLQAAGEFQDGRTPRFMREFAAKNKLDVEKTVKECRATFARDGAIDMASLERSLEWSASKKYATRRVRAEEIVDGRYLERARAMLKSGEWKVAAG